MPGSLSLAGKRPSQSLMVPCDKGQSRSRLFGVQNRMSNPPFLVGTEAENSVFPLSYAERLHRRPGSPRQVVSGSRIATHGVCSFSLHLRLRRFFRWSFTIVSVSHPILKFDFFAFQNSSINVRSKSTFDDLTTPSVNGAASREL